MARAKSKVKAKSTKKPTSTVEHGKLETDPIKFVVRMAPRTHKALKKLARDKLMSMNQIINEVMVDRVFPTGASVDEKLDVIIDHLVKQAKKKK